MMCFVSSGKGHPEHPRLFYDKISLWKKGKQGELNLIYSAGLYRGVLTSQALLRTLLKTAFVY